MPSEIFPDYGNRIVMAPVHAHVTMGSHHAVIFIGRCRTYRQGQRIGIVVRVQ